MLPSEHSVVEQISREGGVEGLTNVWGAGLGLVVGGPERERRRGRIAGGAVL